MKGFLMKQPNLKDYLKGEYTLEEIMAYIDHQLELQGKPAIIQYNGGPVCALRTPDGCKCAIGHIIPDDEFDAYQANKESIIVNSGIYDYIYTFYPKELMQEEKLKPLYKIQRAHDKAAYYTEGSFIENYRKELSNLL